MIKQNLKKLKETKPRFFKRSDILKDIKTPQFPKIYRTITDPTTLKLRGASLAIGNIAKINAFWVGIVMGIIVIGILIVGSDLSKNIAEKKAMDSEKINILSEIKYWEDVAKKHKGYRDGYFKLALLEYKIGNIKKSEEYLNEVFKLDPGFEKGKELERLLNGN